MTKQQEGGKDNNVTVTTTRRSLRWDFSDDEKLRMGLELARENEEATAVEERKKEVDSQLKAEIDSHVTKGQSLSRKINNGYEYRDIPVTITKDLNTNTYSEVRDDTGECLVERALSAEERQAKLDV